MRVEGCEVMSIFSSEAYTKRHGDAQTQAQGVCVEGQDGKLYEIDEVSKKKKIRSGSFDGKGAVRRKKKALVEEGTKSKAATRTREAQHDDIAGPLIPDYGYFCLVGSARKTDAC